MIEMHHNSIRSNHQHHHRFKLCNRKRNNHPDFHFVILIESYLSRQNKSGRAIFVVLFSSTKTVLMKSLTDDETFKCFNRYIDRQIAVLGKAVSRQQRARSMNGHRVQSNNLDVLTNSVCDGHQPIVDRRTNLATNYHNCF